MTGVFIPNYIRCFLRELEHEGFQAYLVGGCVRDRLLNKAPNDWDVCTDALPEELKALFDGVKATSPRVRASPAQDPFPDDPRVKAIRFSGLPDRGRETSVFAYIGFPAAASEPPISTSIRGLRPSSRRMSSSALA